MTRPARVRWLLAGLVSISGAIGSDLRQVTAQSTIDPTAALLVEVILADTSNPPGREGLIGDRAPQGRRVEAADPAGRFALNEGGWIIKRQDGRVQYVSISTADKLSLPVILTARGTSTHSSMPRPDSAIFTLARALAKLADYETEVTLTPSTRQFFQTLAKTSGPPMSEHFRNLTGANPELVRRADREISKDPLLHAIMRNTIAPVLMNAGFRSNVIPGSAEATVNIRLIPGTDPAELIREFQRVIGEPTVEVRLGAQHPVAPPPSFQDTELYRALEKHARQQASPWLGLGARSIVRSSE